MKCKYLFIFFVAIGFSKKGLSQGNVFQNNYVAAGYAVGDNKLALPFEVNGQYDGNPYFSKDWVKGSVKTTDNNEFHDKLLFIYDKVDGNLYFKKQDSTTIMQADKSKIYSFTLLTDKPHTFMQGDFFSKDYAGKFFEVLLLDDKKYSLLKYTTTSFQEPETSKASQAMTESISHGKYVDKGTYFLYFDNTLQPIELKKKTFSKTLKPDDVSKADEYIKETNGNFNEAYVILMLQDINSSGQ